MNTRNLVTIYCHFEIFVFLLYIVDPVLGDLLSIGEYVPMVTKVLALARELW